MMPRLYDLADAAVAYLPHRFRKWLGAKAFSLFNMITAPPCQDRSCCWAPCDNHLSGFEPCQPPRPNDE